MAGLRVAITFAANGAQQVNQQVQQMQQRLNQVGQSAQSAGGRGGAAIGAIGGAGQKALSGVVNLAFGFNQVMGAVQGLKAAIMPAYDLLIGANEQLNQQLLASQANIASSVRIFKDGLEVTEPLEKINATQGALRDALKQLEEDTRSLVGVTSSEVNEVFQILLQNSAALANQSQEFPDSLAAATNQAKGFVATLGTLGIPLDQARQEINSILQGQITSDSVLAKSLGLTNQMVADWKAQGELVDQLNNRFTVFVEGNALAARSISGITSNIQDIIEVVGRQAGEPLLEPIVSALEQLYVFLDENQEAIQAFIGDAVLKFLALADAVGNAAIRVGEALLPALKALVPAGGEFAEVMTVGIASLAEGIARAVEVIAPFITKMAEGIAKIVNLIQFAQDKLGMYTGAYEDSTDAAEVWGNVTAQNAEEAIQKQKELVDAANARQEAEKQGIELTDKQVAAEQEAKKSADEMIERLKAHKAELMGVMPIGEENRQNIANQIAETEKWIAALEESGDAVKSNADGIELAAKDLEDLGSAYEQLEAKAQQAKTTLEQGAGGDLTQAKAAAQELIELTNQRRELGQITAEEAISELNQIRNNNKLSYEEQLAAEEAITQIKQNEVDKRVDAIDAQIAETEALVESGQISEVEGEQRVTEAKLEQLNIRLEAVRAAIAQEEALGRGKGDKANALKNEAKQIEAQIATTQAQSAKKLAAAQAKELDDRLKKATQAIKLAETEREKAINQGILNGTMSQREADEQRLKSAADRIQQEIALEQQKIAQLAALGNNDEEVAAAKLKLAELQNQAIQNQIQQEEALQKKIQDGLRDQIAEYQRKTQEVTLGIEKEVKANQMIEDSLNRQQQLMQSKADLVAAQQGLQQTLGQIELDRVNRAMQIQQQLSSEQELDANVRKQLETELQALGFSGQETVIDLLKQKQEIEDNLAQQRLEALKAEQAQQLAALELDIQRNQLAAERAILQSQAAQAQAEQNKIEAELQLEIAKAIRDPEERDRQLKAAQAQIKVAEQGLELALKDVEATKESANLQEELANNQREVLKLQQQTALAAEENKELFREQAQALELVQAEAEELKKKQEAAMAEKEKSQKEPKKEESNPKSQKEPKKEDSNTSSEAGTSQRTKTVRMPPGSKELAEYTNRQQKDLKRTLDLAGKIRPREIILDPPKMGMDFGALAKEVGAIRDEVRQLSGVLANSRQTTVNVSRSSATTLTDIGRGMAAAANI
ncbi:MAG: hypothetical protein SAJ12_09290 [Jaaginema sp. PMC 1079.18]|nr:hypothetical protein [Jaaginema sp. PMC 1080.18]MEC4851194.1 hypothetical protein [Jaaginema sp. PMC 1079.18]MEC4864787.1 hypothetical protein [Jaaginema sp. PMC 1078.18]